MKRFKHGDGKGGAGAPHGRKARAKPGTYLAKCIAIEEASLAKSGKYYHRLRFQLLGVDADDIWAVIACTEDGDLVGRWGWPRLEAIAAAVGIDTGAEYGLQDLLWSPLRVTLEMNGEYLNCTKFERITPMDRAELAEYEARSAEIGGNWGAM